MKRLALIALGAVLIAAGNPATETVHVVKDGETLGGIANRAKVPAAVIAAANGLQEPYDVQAGDRLAIPRQRTHVVKRGETSQGIANRYGVPLINMALANGLSPPYKVRSGQKLIIPAVIKSRNITRRSTSPRKTPYFRRPHDGRVLYGYSWRGGKGGRGHEGVDFAVKTGDMVRAAASGTVVYAQRDSGRFGRLVVLDHGNGWRTRYGHLSRITVKLGDVVKTGERIGLAGSDGSARKPELHFDILKNNVPIDPRGKLARR